MCIPSLLRAPSLDRIAPASLGRKRICGITRSVAAYPLLATPLASQAQTAPAPMPPAHDIWITLGTMGGPMPRPGRNEPTNLPVRNREAHLVDTGDGAMTEMAANIRVVELDDGAVANCDGFTVRVTSNTHYSFPPGSEEERTFRSLSHCFDLPDRSTLYTGNTGQSAQRDPLTLRYRAPAPECVEALPLGNGRLGAMVFGGTATEQVQLNEDTFFAGSPHTAPGDGRIGHEPLNSPENAHHPGASVAADAALDGQLLRDLFTRTAQAANLLDRDADRAAALLAVRARLPGQRIGEAGQLQEWLENRDMGAQRPYRGL